MVAQLLYNANYDKQLLYERRKAKGLCHVYNTTSPDDE